MKEITIIVPWTPDSRCRPNAKCSERTKIRYRKQGALAAVYPMRAAYLEHKAEVTGQCLFVAPVVLDIEIRWEKGRQRWDSDAVVTAFKYVRDVLESESIVFTDKEVVIGRIVQERATQQPESVLTLHPVNDH